MDEQRTVMVVGDDPTARQLSVMLARHNITVLGAGLAAGLPLDMLTGMCVPLDRAKPKAPPEPSEAERRALAAAEAKRQRRAAKRQHRAPDQGAAGLVDSALRSATATGSGE